MRLSAEERLLSVKLAKVSNTLNQKVLAMKKRFERCFTLALCGLSFALLAPTALYWFDAQIVAGDHAPEFTSRGPAANLAELVSHQKLLSRLDEDHFTSVAEQREATSKAIVFASKALDLNEESTDFQANMYLLSGEMNKLRDGHQMTPLSAGRYVYPLVFGGVVFLVALLGAWWNRSALATETYAF
jgi:hypothetical protein